MIKQRPELIDEAPVDESGEDLAAARAAYRRALDEESGDAQVFMDCGAIFEQYGESGDAFGAYERAARLEPASAEPFYRMGRCLSGEVSAALAYPEMLDEVIARAVAAFEAAIARDRAHAEAWRDLTQGYLIAGLAAEATASARSWMETVAGDPVAEADALYMLGLAQAFADAAADAPSAVFTLKRLLAIEPHMPDALFALGLAYLRLGEVGRVYQECSPLAESDPELWACLERLAARGEFSYRDVALERIGGGA